jgi:translation initiation factor IF-3
MPSIELKGTVVKVGQTEQRSESFKSRQLILKTDTDTQYPQEINIEFNQAKSDLLDVIKEGSKVKVSTNLNGRKWTNKEGKDLWFNSINAWKIEVLSQPEEDADLAL